MITQNEIHHNGNGTNGHYLNCASDYEPAPVIDITPAAPPKPAWRDQHPLFVHHLEWVDRDDVSHGLTLRSDDLQSLMADLRLVKSMIRQAKQKHSVPASPAHSQPQQPDTQTPSASVRPICAFLVRMGRRRIIATTARHRVLPR